MATSIIKCRTNASATRFTLTPHEDLSVNRNIAVLEGNLLYIDLVFAATGKTFANGTTLFELPGYKLAAQLDTWAISDTDKAPKIRITSTTNNTGLNINNNGILTGFSGFYVLCCVIPVIPA